MAELIKRTDNLNQGREKLNESIKDANKAKEDAIKALARSLSAEQIAQLAELKSDDTQQQLDNIIIESGTSDAETIQARGSYPLLKDRLNSVDQDLAQNIEKTASVLPLTFFGVDESGEQYSDNAFNDALQYAVENNITEVIGNKKARYKLLNPVSIPSGVRLDLKGSFVDSFVDEEYRGSFEMKGAVDDELFYLTENVIEGDLHLQLQPEQGDWFEGVDYVVISQSYSGSTDPAYKYTKQLLKVKEILGDTIILDKPIVHSYFTENGVRIQKAYPVIDAEVVNAKIDHQGTTKRVHGVLMEITDGCYEDNIRDFNGGGKGVQTILTRSFGIGRIRVKNRTNVEAGHGYAVMCSNSSYGTIKSVNGYGTRHTVDLSDGSHNINIGDSFAFQNETAAFSTHGQNCKHIVFDGCHSIGGVYGFAIGNASFNYDTDVIVSNCIATKASTSGFNAGSGSSNIKFANCIADNCQNSFQSSGGNNVSFNGCDSKNSGNKAFDILNSREVKIIDAGIFGLNKIGINIENTINSILSVANVSDKLNGEGALIIRNSQDIIASGVVVDVESTLGSMVRILGGSQHILMSEFTIKGVTPRYALEIIENSSDVNIADASIRPSVGIDSIRMGITSTDNVKDITITNSTIITAGSNSVKRAVRSWAKGVKLVNSKIEGYVSFLADGPTIVNANRIYGTLDIRATKGVIYTNNIGNYQVIELGQHDGVNIIRKDNLENIA